MRLRALTLSTAALALGATALVTPSATAAEGTTRTQQVVTSPDGTQIWSTLFLPAGASAADPRPVVLEGHGWGGSGVDEETGRVATLLADGYAVMTWDARGFGRSGGYADVDSPDREAKDVSALLDFLAAQPAVEQEAPGDPVVGMTGLSYGGGIQLVTAAHDPRVDAIAPEIAWNDLRRALVPGTVPKEAWLSLLAGNGAANGTVDGVDPTSPIGIQTGSVSPEVLQAFTEASTTASVSAESLAYYRDRSLAGWGAASPVRVPTLLMQGSSDTLFDLAEAVANYEAVKATGAPVRMVVFCGSLSDAATSHGECPPSHEAAGVDDRAHLDAAILDWFGRYLRAEGGKTGPAIEYRTNEGVWRSLRTWPVAGDRKQAVVSGSALGSAVSSGVPTSGPAVYATPSPAGDPGTVTGTVATAPAGGLELVGTPRATLRLTGTGSGAFLFVKLVDRETGEVVNYQETPVRVGPLSATPQEVTVDLVPIAHTLPAGHHLDVQVATSSAQFAVHQGAATVTVDASVSVPVVAP